MLYTIDELNKSGALPHTCNVRIGINSGPVVAGIVGTKKFLYDRKKKQTNKQTNKQTWTKTNKHELNSLGRCC